MKSIFFFIHFFFFLANCLEATLEKKIYPLSTESIDVVIPCAVKDQQILKHCIEGIKKYGQNIRRIIVVSKEQLSPDAEWFDETKYPFKKEELAYEIFHGNSKKAEKFLAQKNSRIGWIFQQFLKLYAPFVIPDISSNVLIVDADVIFTKPISFINEKGEPFFNTATEYHLPYFEHMKKVLPDLIRVQEKKSGITHHMLFQKSILEDLFSLISKKHKTVAWKALCRTIDQSQVNNSSLSEYEIYFNFVQLRTNQAHLRSLQFKNVFPLRDIKKYEKNKYSYVTSHNYS